MCHWLALILAILAKVGGKVALKNFSAQMPDHVSVASVIGMLRQPWLWAGAAMAGTVFFSYIWALRGVLLSVAYPIGTGLSAVGVLLVAGLLLGEAVSIAKIAGIVMVAAGVLLIT